MAFGCIEAEGYEGYIMDPKIPERTTDPIIIGFAGRAGVGKTTMAIEFTEKKYKGGLSVIVLSFASQLKKTLTVLTGLEEKYFYDTDLKEEPIVFGKTPRQLMQLFGTEFVREMIDYNFWVWRMEQEIDKFLPMWDIIIDDCRFENETALVREKGGVIVHLTREYNSLTTETSHKSENVLEVKKEDIEIFSRVGLNEVDTYSLVVRGLKDAGIFK